MTDINIFEAAYDAAEADCKALRAENERLREALAPFREWLDKLDAEFADESDDTIVAGLDEATFTFGDLRRARAAWAKEVGK